MQQKNSSTVRHRRQKNKLRKNISSNDLTRNNQQYKTLSNSYEKSTFTYLGQRHLKNGAKNSPVQTKARAVIRKYKLQLRQLEFKRLQQILPTMQNSDSTNDSDEVSTKVIYIKSVVTLFYTPCGAVYILHWQLIIFSQDQTAHLSTKQTWMPYDAINYMLRLLHMTTETIL